MSPHSQFNRSKNEKQDVEKSVKRDDGYTNLQQAFAEKGILNANCDCYIEINDKGVGAQTLSVLVPTKIGRPDIRGLKASAVSGSGQFCGDVLNFEIVKSWFREEAVQDSDVEKFTNAADNFCHIEIQRRCLTKAHKSQRYVVLNYVWGGPQTLLTLKANLGSLEKAGSLPKDHEELPGL